MSDLTPTIHSGGYEILEREGIMTIEGEGGKPLLQFDSEVAKEIHESLSRHFEFVEFMKRRQESEEGES